MRDFFIQYFRHSALNLGQALQGMRYFYSHPDFDQRARRGSPKHFLLSLGLRAKRVVNDLFFAIVPPHWHHTPDEMKSFHGISARRWFWFGFSAWRFDDNGEFKALTGQEDPRWDPRCR